MLSVPSLSFGRKHHKHTFVHGEGLHRSFTPYICTWRRAASVVYTIHLYMEKGCIGRKHHTFVHGEELHRSDLFVLSPWLRRYNDWVKNQLDKKPDKPATGDSTSTSTKGKGKGTPVVHLISIM